MSWWTRIRRAEALSPNPAGPVTATRSGSHTGVELIPHLPAHTHTCTRLLSVVKPSAKHSILSSVVAAAAAQRVTAFSAATRVCPGGGGFRRGARLAIASAQAAITAAGHYRP